MDDPLLAGRTGTGETGVPFVTAGYRGDQGSSSFDPQALADTEDVTAPLSQTAATPDRQRLPAAQFCLHSPPDGGDYHYRPPRSQPALAVWRQRLSEDAFLGEYRLVIFLNAELDQGFSRQRPGKPG